MGILIGIAAIIVAVVFWNVQQTKARRQRLLAKYGDPAVIERIMNRKVWQGMSEAQLIDSWGNPAGRDSKVMKTKVTNTFKYNQVGHNRFRSRVQVENGIVVGWTQK